MTALSPAIRLTISIPTFDRPELLLKLLRSLLPQTDDSVVIRILDNCSPMPVSSLIRESFDSRVTDRIDVRRNAANIGANANIMRCMELCETDWLWMIGDDEEVLPDAIATALRLIARHPESVLMNCHVLAPRKTPFSTRGLDEFAARVDHLEDVIFISTNLFRVQALRSSIRLGCHYTASWMPHVFTVLRSLGEDGVCWFVSEQLVHIPPRRESANHYSLLGYCSGCGLLLDLPMSARTRRALARKLYWDRALIIRIYFHVALMRLQGESSAELRYQSRQVYHRWLSHCRWPMFGVLNRALLAFSAGLPKLYAWVVVKAARRFTTKRPSMSDLPDPVARL